MVIKLAIANAFDRACHHFLVASLQKFGTSPKFIKIIDTCISNPWIATLINGRPNRYFCSTRGLRQGCPLSHFLYIIMAEILSIQLENQRIIREITGIRIARGVKEINHSLFSDDTLLIGDGSSIISRRFKKVLDEFLAVSRGLLNNKKCRIYTCNVPNNIMQRIYQILEIPVQQKWSHFIYLGLPLAKKGIKTETWNKQIEKVRGKIQSWWMM